MSPLLELRVRDLLDAIAAENPTPGAGALAALVGALAAALTAMAARSSHAWGAAGGVVAQAIALRSRLEWLAPANDEAYEAALASLHVPAALEPEARNALLAQSLARAASTPLAIVEAAASVADLAALVAEEAEHPFRADAAAAAVLADGAARAAAALVRTNLTVHGDDERIVAADRLVGDAAEAVSRALAASA